MSSREAIFARVRAGVADGRAALPGEEAERRAAVEACLAGHRRNLMPARATAKSSAELVALLKRWLEMAGGELIEAVRDDDVPAAVVGFLRRHNLPMRIRMGEDARLAAIGWSREAQLDVAKGRAGPNDLTGVTHALAAVAETATMMVPSGADNPVTLSFLPENNIILVRRADVVGPLEDAIERLRAARNGAMPRTLNLISGPSRSADIGGIPVLGAHGPKRLAVIVVG